MTCDGCKGEISDGQPYLELGVVLKTAGSLLPIAVSNDVIKVHYTHCFTRYCYENATVRDVFGR